MNNDSNPNNFKTAMFADCLANSREIFQLIEQIFPLDSCQHYQVLPLNLEGNELTVGMLDPNNNDSLNFVNSIAKVFKYNLEIQLIDLQTWQIILANYPQDYSPTNRKVEDRKQTVIDTNFNPNAPSNSTNRPRLVDSAPTIISQPAKASSESNAKSESLKLSNLPPDLDFLKDLELTPKSKNQAAAPKTDANATLFEVPPEFLNQKPAKHLDNKATIIVGNPAEQSAEETFRTDSEIADQEAQRSQLIAETLGKFSPESTKPNTDFLSELTPQLSWQKLMEEVFRHNTDYLRLIRHSDRGSIIAEQNKLTQSCLESVSLPLFCSLIDEIKRMIRLPRNTSTHPKKVVFEKFHNQERILLRVEFVVEQESESVGIQILRHQALKRYEQQQMDRISEQALQLAKQLEKTLRKIQACFNTAEFANLTELQTVHSRINHQLRLLDKQN